MAEIHVERRRGVGTWIWVALIVIVLLAIGFYCWRAGYINLSMNQVTGYHQLALMNVGGLHVT